MNHIDTDREAIWNAMHDFMQKHGFEAMMTVVGAGIVAAHQLDGMPPEPQPQLDWHEELYRDRTRHGEMLHPDPKDDEPANL